MDKVAALSDLITELDALLARYRERPTVTYWAGPSEEEGRRLGQEIVDAVRAYRSDAADNPEA